MQDMWQSSYVQHDQDELCLSRYNMEHSSFYTRLVDATRAVNIHKKQNSLVLAIKVYLQSTCPVWQVMHGHTASIKAVKKHGCKEYTHATETNDLLQKLNS